MGNELREAKIIEKYSFYPIKEDAQLRINRIREGFSTLESLLLETAPASRLLSIALTDLESAAMFAIKSIAHDPANRA